MLHQALYAISQGKVFEAYELYMAAGLYQSAHDLAVVELAPEAVIRQDFDLLTSLFERMANQSIDGWYLKGKARPYLLLWCHILSYDVAFRPT